MFSKVFVIAILALLERFWRPSGLLLDRFGPQNGDQHIIKTGPKSDPVFGDFLDQFWDYFGVHFGAKDQLKQEPKTRSKTEPAPTGTGAEGRGVAKASKI
jgi:hypothetical protein